MTAENDILELEASEPVAAPVRATSPSAMRAGLSGRMSTAQPKTSDGFLSKLWRKSKAPLQAAHDPCCVVGVLMVLDRGLALDGLVTGISSRGVMFRQASHFIFDRTGAEISIRFGTHDRRGRIEHVAASGYDIRLNDPLSERDIDEILNGFGLSA
ncbi:MAG: hypothetical protein ACRDBH_04180 [Bosea sp. (in: a-proteobacteria)]